MNLVLSYVITFGLVFVFVVVFFRLIRIVPEQEAWIIEQFGKYLKTLGPGFHLVVPVVQKVAYKQLLKEEVVDVKPQICITKDNVQVTVDGVLYLRVVDAAKACYGIDDYRFATAQLAQTTMRSEVGKIDLDRAFSERDTINNAIVRSIDEASDPWGIKVTRYEIKDLDPPESVRNAMEGQMRAEREKRADILKSEGERSARINISKGEREEAINLSKGERQRRINVAEGKAKEIELMANATAEGIAGIADAIERPKGRKAMSFRITERFIEQLGKIIDTANTSVLPLEAAQIRSLFQTVLPPRRGTAPDQSQPTSEALERLRSAFLGGKRQPQEPSEGGEA
jgi:regulator of protease activity HflC (stomatin/prohibitin superfamily)